MKWKLATGPLREIEAESLALGVFEDLDFAPLSGLHALDDAAKKLRFKGKPGESFFAFDLFGKPKKHLLVVGLGKRDDHSPAGLRSAAALAARRLRERYVKVAVMAFPFGEGPERAADFAQALVEGASYGSRRFDQYLSDEDSKFEGLARLVIAVAKRSRAIEDGARRGELIAGAVLFARRLVTEPSNVLTPERMAEEARQVAREAGFSIKILGPRECEKLGMGAYLAVAKGSKNEARFIHMSYRPKGAKFRLGIVGKGLTFDSGGLSLKPNEGMAAMKSDMSGSAAVLAAMKAIGALKPRVAVEAVMAMAENMPDGGAYKPGDILKSMGGKTIEILNTDAEGRLTLADALTFVQKQDVDAVVDLATLTGACVVALGPDFTGAMTNNQAFCDEVLAAARSEGEEVWQLPMPPAYNKLIQSPVADVANSARVRWGGAITAGLFLKKFIEGDKPWVHLDIAGPAYRDEDGADAFRAEGSGVGVRTLVRLVLSKDRVNSQKSKVKSENRGLGRTR
jgi:leucyl aminopeptidase